MSAKTTVDKKETPKSASTIWLDRDLSLMAFNRRVLDWARRDEVPLLERLRYLCIVSSNLDEFFEVRGALHVGAGYKPNEQDLSFNALSTAAHELVKSQYDLYNQVLLPAFAKRGVQILAHGERTQAQKLWVKRFFEQEVKPLLLPISLDPAHPFPQVANKSLNFIVRLSGQDAFGRDNEIAIVKVPRVLPRLIQLPSRLSGRRKLFVAISSVIRAHLQDLFPGRVVGEFSQFRVTRHSDLAVDEEDAKNLRTALRQGLAQRHFGQAVRLEVSSACSAYLSSFLLQQFNLSHDALFMVNGPVNWVRLNQLIDLVDDPQMLFSPYVASYPHQLNVTTPIIEQIQTQDVVIHQPYESFNAVLTFLQEAVRDPQVLAIKQTIYRTGADSEMMALLHEAVQRGKEVTAVVELKARFDEEANINWAEKLEHIGAQVVYGVVGLKTHAKMLLITRREGRSLKRYVHLSTGNYNPRTARLYTDLSYLSSDVKLTHDVESVFSLLANQSKLPRLHKLWVAPFNLQRNLVDLTDRVAKAQLEGQKGRIVLKMNSLTDERLMEALLKAAQVGVSVDLIVRGACMLPALKPGVAERIRVRSVIGRLLEHSRVFYFQSGTQDHLYLSSADWMNRNMIRRVEIAWPVTEMALKQRIVRECLQMYLEDTQDAWLLQADGDYVRHRASKAKTNGATPLSAQSLLMARYAATE
jgi:polyphosphate kinase